MLVGVELCTTVGLIVGALVGAALGFSVWAGVVLLGWKLGSFCTGTVGASEEAV